MWSYATLLTDDTPEEIENRKSQVSAGRLHPMEAKKSLARQIVARFHGSEAAEQAREEFVRVFSRREDPAAVEEIALPAGEDGALPRILSEAGLAPSNAEARRLISSGAVDVDDVRITDPKFAVSRKAGAETRLRVGKRRFAKIRFQ
jgi:tyrosyl-tRNA synthetase